MFTKPGPRTFTGVVVRRREDSFDRNPVKITLAIELEAGSGKGILVATGFGTSAVGVAEKGDTVSFTLSAAPDFSVQERCFLNFQILSLAPSQ